MAHIKIERELEAHDEARRNYHVFKTIGMAADVLHEYFGFGRIRLCRFVQWLGDVSAENLQDTIDGVDDELLCRRLERMKMPELADIIRAARDKLDEMRDEAQ